MHERALRSTFFLGHKFPLQVLTVFPEILLEVLQRDSKFFEKFFLKIKMFYKEESFECFMNITSIVPKKKFEKDRYFKSKTKLRCARLPKVENAMGFLLMFLR